MAPPGPLMFGQGFDELIDFFFGVVHVRAGAQAAAADGDHDAVFVLQVRLERFGGVHVGKEGNNSAGLILLARTEYAITLIAHAFDESCRT